MRAVLALLAAAAGLVAAVPVNAVIERVPAREPVGPALRWAVPPDRKDRIVAAVTAATFAALALRFGWSPALPAWLVLAAALVAISVIDLEHYIVPNRILIPLTVVAVPLLALAVADDAHRLADLGRGIVGAVVGFGVLFVLNLISPRGMGMGDVKMSFVLGLYLGFLGWGELVLGFFAAFVLGAVVGVALIAAKLRTRKDAVPFGPFLAGGTVLAALWGGPILRWYTGS